jgi:hypothetical protein
MSTNVEACDSIFRSDFGEEVHGMAKLSRVGVAKHILVGNDSPDVKHFSFGTDLNIFDLFAGGKLIYDCIQRSILMRSKWRTTNRLFWKWECEIIREGNWQDGRFGPIRDLVRRVFPALTKVGLAANFTLGRSW